MRAHECRYRNPSQAATAGSLCVIQFLTRSPKTTRDYIGIFHECLSRGTHRPAAFIFQYLRQLPMIECDKGYDSSCEQAIYKVIVKVEAFLLDHTASILAKWLATRWRSDKLSAQVSASGEYPSSKGDNDIIGNITVLVVEYLARRMRESIPD